MKRFIRLMIFVLFFSIVFNLGCFLSSDDDDDESSGATISSLGDDMKKCAPDLSAAAIVVWEDGDDGWSGHVTYGVLKKHFDPDSGSESIYSVVNQIDTMSSTLTSLAASMTGTSGSVTSGAYTVTYSVPGSVTLPSIFGSAVITDFEKKYAISGDGMSATFYYKSGTDEKLLCYFANSLDKGVVYAVRNTTSGALAVNVASHKSATALPTAGSAHVDADFRCYLYFEGNITAKTFKFKLKTDAATGWTFFGGGSVASDSSMIAVRGTNAADSLTYANDGGGLNENSDSADTYYVMLTFGNMKDSTYDGGGYPKDGTTANLGAETDSAADFITIGNANSLIATLAALKAVKYPAEAAELAITE